MAKSKPQRATITSRTWGIMGIVLGLFIPLLGIVFGIIGLSIRDSKKSQGDRVLNIAAIAIGVIALIIHVPW